jgi:hypothetical protein
MGQDQRASSSADMAVLGRSITLCREVAPETSSISDLAIDKVLAKYLTSSLLASPFEAGAWTRMTNSPFRTPTIWFRPALGKAFTLRIILSSLIVKGNRSAESDILMFFEVSINTIGGFPLLFQGPVLRNRSGSLDGHPSLEIPLVTF